MQVETVFKERVIPGQAGNKCSKPKCGLSSKIKFLVDRLFIPVSTLYLHSFFPLKVQVAAQLLFQLVAILLRTRLNLPREVKNSSIFEQSPTVSFP